MTKRSSEAEDETDAVVDTKRVKFTETLSVDHTTEDEHYDARRLLADSTHKLNTGQAKTTGDLAFTPRAHDVQAQKSQLHVVSNLHKIYTAEQLVLAGYMQATAARHQPLTDSTTSSAAAPDATLPNDSFVSYVLAQLAAQGVPAPPTTTPAPPNAGNTPAPPTGAPSPPAPTPPTPPPPAAPSPAPAPAATAAPSATSPQPPVPPAHPPPLSAPSPMDTDAPPQPQPAATAPTADGPGSGVRPSSPKDTAQLLRQAPAHQHPTADGPGSGARPSSPTDTAQPSSPTGAAQALPPVDPVAKAGPHPPTSDAAAPAPESAAAAAAAPASGSGGGSSSPAAKPASTAARDGVAVPTPGDAVPPAAEVKPEPAPADDAAGGGAPAGEAVGGPEAPHGVGKGGRGEAGDDPATTSRAPEGGQGVGDSSGQGSVPGATGSEAQAAGAAEAARPDCPAGQGAAAGGSNGVNQGGGVERAAAGSRAASERWDPAHTLELYKGDALLEARGGLPQPLAYPQLVAGLLRAQVRGAAGAASFEGWAERCEGALGGTATMERLASAFWALQMDRQDAIAALSGRGGVYLLKRSTVLLGRSSDSRGHVDIDLGREGPTGKVSRRQAVITVQLDGSFNLVCTGRRPMLLNGQPVTRGKVTQLPHLALLEVGGIPLLFTANHLAVARVLRRTAALAM